MNINEMEHLAWPCTKCGDYYLWRHRSDASVCPCSSCDKEAKNISAMKDPENWRRVEPIVAHLKIMLARALEMDQRITERLKSMEAERAELLQARADIAAALSGKYVYKIEDLLNQIKIN